MLCPPPAGIALTLRYILNNEVVMKTRWLLAASLAAVGFATGLWAGENIEAKNSIAPLTLEGATQLAMDQNPELKALASDAEAAKTKSSKARYWDDPMIGVRFYQVPFEGGVGQIEDIDYIVRQKFPIGGKDKAQAQMAYHEYQHRLHLLSGKGREIIRDLKTAYAQLFSLQRQLAVSRENEGQLRSIVGSAHSKLASGKANASEAMLGQTEIAKVLADRQMLLQQMGEWEAKLKTLMAVDQPTGIRIPSKMASLEWDVDLERVLSVAKERHPALASERHHIEEREWGVKAAKKEFIPDINFQAEYVQRPGDRVDAFTGEVMINVPLILRKKNLGVKQAEAELASARFMGQSRANEIQGKVKELYTRMTTNRRILGINRRTQVSQARQALQSAAQAYRVEQGNFADVLTASRMLLMAQSDYWKTFADQAASVFALEEAIGATREELEQEERK